MNQIRIVDKRAIKHLSTYGLALFLFLTSFEYPLADLMAISPLRIVGLFAMGLAFLDICMQKTLRIDYRILYVFLWLFYGFITILWVSNKTRFQSYYSIYLNNALMFLLFSMIPFSKHEANILKKSTIFGVGTLLLYMTFVPGAVIYSRYQGRLTLNAGTEGMDQNYLAALMLFSFGIVFYDLCNVEQKKSYKILSIVFCLTIAYYVLLTGSRSGLLALLLIVLLSINTSWKTRMTIGIPIIVLLIIVFPFVLQYIPENVITRFSFAAFTGHAAESSTRLLIWEKALNSVKNFKWVFGCGVGSSQTIVGNILGNGKDMAIHNHYIALLVEVGIVGLFLMTFPVFKMFSKVWRVERSIAVAFSGILLMSFFLDVLTTKFFWSAMILLSIYCSSCVENAAEDGGES